MDNNFDNQNQASEQSGGILGKATSMFSNIDMNKIPDSIKQYGTTAATSVKNMSTTQKVVGGAILAAGAWYIANKSKNGGFKTSASQVGRSDY